MKRIPLGKDAEGATIYLTPALRARTHMHVIGSSGTGKSKFLEWMIRKDLQEGHGFCVIDWHGKLYNDVLRFCAHLDVGVRKDYRRLVLLNPSRPDFITGFNPFANPGEDISTQVSKRIDATIKPWGAKNTNETPTFARLARVLYTFMAEAGQTLPNAATLLEFDRRELREFAICKVTDSWVKAQWRSLQDIKTARDWREQVLSTDNRLARFIGSSGVRRFMGLETNNIDLLDIMDRGKILLVNLGDSGFLDREAARVFASLFLNEFFGAAMLRANRLEGTRKDPNQYLLYLDEFQEYITDDIAAMLDQVRKGGLHIVLAHQHLGHLAEDPKLKKSVFTNAKVRAVFGGLDYEDSCVLGNEMFLPDLNSRQIKKAYYHTIHHYQEQTRVVRSSTSSHGRSDSTTQSAGTGSSVDSASATAIGQSSALATSVPRIGVPLTEGWLTRTTSSSKVSSHSSASSQSSSRSASRSHVESDSESFTDTVVPVWVPIPLQELTTEAEWTREEKLSKVAQLLSEQMQQHCFIKIGTDPTQPLLVPFVKEYGLPERSLLEYQREAYERQGALPAADVDHLLEESHQNFLAAASQIIDVNPEDASPPLAEAEPQRRNRASEGMPLWAGWRAGSPRPRSAPSIAQPRPAKQPSSGRKKPGPRQDTENQFKVLEITSRYGEAWDTEDSLSEVCQALDDSGVPVPPRWWSRKDIKAQTWNTALRNNPKAVKRAIRDRLKAARKAKAAETA